MLVPYLWVLLAFMDVRILSSTDHFDMVQIPTFTKYANENAYQGQVATDVMDLSKNQQPTQFFRKSRKQHYFEKGEMFC